LLGRGSLRWAPSPGQVPFVSDSGSVSPYKAAGGISRPAALAACASATPRGSSNPIGRRSGPSPSSHFIRLCARSCSGRIGAVGKSKLMAASISFAFQLVTLLWGAREFPFTPCPPSVCCVGEHRPRGRESAPAGIAREFDPVSVRQSALRCGERSSPLPPRRRQRPAQALLRRTEARHSRGRRRAREPCAS